jgi:hypothetical protein
VSTVTALVLVHSRVAAVEIPLTTVLVMLTTDAEVAVVLTLEAFVDVAVVVSPSMHRSHQQCRGR